MKESLKNAVIGKAIDRVDGVQKVTGAAKYAAEYGLDNLAFAVLIQSAISKGKIRAIDSSEAEKLQGVLKIITYKNAGKLPVKPVEDFDETLHLLQDNQVHFDRQNIGIVVAESYEIASQAATLVNVDYEEERAQVSMEKNMTGAKFPNNKSSVQKRGNFEGVYKNAAVKMQETYVSPSEIHSSMEAHATTARWDGDRLEIWESTQAIFNTRNKLAKAFGIPASNVHVICKFLGGGFGTKLSTWSGTILAALAARETRRPVRLFLSRANTFGGTGFRPRTVQTLTVASSEKGKLLGIKHDCFSETCRFHDFVEDGSDVSLRMYSCPNVIVSTRIIPLDIGKPTWMRAPGECPGMFALESAMDELSYKVNIDPLQLRLLNFACKDEHENLPWSSNALKSCYEQGAARFGWSKRKPQPRSMKSGNLLLGWGMAAGTHPFYRLKASAKLIMDASGQVKVSCGTQDIGTGTYTIMTQIAADLLGVPMANVQFDLGDTDMPEAPLSGGSMTAVTAGSAVHAACLSAITKLAEMASADKTSPLFGVGVEDLFAHEQGLYVRSHPQKGETYVAILRKAGLDKIELTASAESDKESQKYSKHSFAAHFAEVMVDEELGVIRVTRFVSAVGAGQIINPKTAASQIKGGIIFGIGMALTEEIIRDESSGRILNADLAEYHLPVHADVPDLDVLFVEERDTILNPLGAKGVGEIANIGVAPAIANAVFHATGKRIRELPITLDKLL